MQDWDWCKHMPCMYNGLMHACGWSFSDIIMLHVVFIQSLKGKHIIFLVLGMFKSPLAVWLGSWNHISGVLMRIQQSQDRAAALTNIYIYIYIEFLFYFFLFFYVPVWSRILWRSKNIAGLKYHNQSNMVCWNESQEEAWSYIQTKFSWDGLLDSRSNRNSIWWDSPCIWKWYTKRLQTLMTWLTESTQNKGHG